MGVETELFGLKNRWDGKEFRVIERADGSIAVLAGEKVLVDSGVTPVTAVPSVSGLGKTRRSVGSRQHVGRLKSSATPADDGFTHQIQWELPAHVDAVQFRFRNNETAAVTIRAVCSPTTKFGIGFSQMYDAAGNAYTTGFSDVTVAGSTSIVMPARIAADRPSYLLTDVIPCATFDRTDGGAYPSVVLRLTTTAGATYSVSQKDHTGYRSGGMLQVRDTRMAGDFVSTNLAGYTTPTFGTSDIYCEVIFYARGQVVSVAAVGDSLIEGIYSDDAIGYVEKACWQLLQSGYPVVLSNHGWHAQTTPLIYPRLVDLLAQETLPDVVIYSPYSINDANTTLTQAIIDGMLARAHQAINACKRAGVGLIMVTGIPSNTNGRNLGATDSFRIAFNQSLAALCATHGVYLADVATPLSGSVSSGQVQIIAGGAVADGLHLTAVGNALARDALVPVLTEALKATTMYAAAKP